MRLDVAIEDQERALEIVEQVLAHGHEVRLLGTSAALNTDADCLVLSGRDSQALRMIRDLRDDGRNPDTCVVLLDAPVAPGAPARGFGAELAIPEGASLATVIAEILRMLAMLSTSAGLLSKAFPDGSAVAPAESTQQLLTTSAGFSALPASVAPAARTSDQISGELLQWLHACDHKIAPDKHPMDLNIHASRKDVFGLVPPEIVDAPEDLARIDRDPVSAFSLSAPLPVTTSALSTKNDGSTQQARKVKPMSSIPGTDRTAPHTPLNLAKVRAEPSARSMPSIAPAHELLGWLARNADTGTVLMSTPNGEYSPLEMTFDRGACVFVCLENSIALGREQAAVELALRAPLAHSMVVQSKARTSGFLATIGDLVLEAARRLDHSAMQEKLAADYSYAGEILPQVSIDRALYEYLFQHPKGHVSEILQRLGAFIAADVYVLASSRNLHTTARQTQHAASADRVHLEWISAVECGSYFDILGVDARATPARVQEAFHQRQRELNAAIYLEPPISAGAQKALREAVEVLTSDRLRAMYAATIS